MDETEENIRRKKDKKRARYFDILINDKKVGILNYKIKDYRNRDEQGHVLEIISQYKFAPEAEGIVMIQIDTPEEILEIHGYWKYAKNGPGNYCNGYWINELIRQPQKN